MKKYFLFLVPIYLLVIILSYFGYVSRSNIAFIVLSIFIAGILILNNQHKNIKLSKWLIPLAFALILLPRIIPYINNDIPIGYDTGVYKYAIEHPFEKWIQLTVPRGFIFPLAFLDLFLPINFILTYLLIGFELLLGFAIYITVKEYFNENIGIMSLMLYSISFVQYRVFTFMYYKNIIALSLLLFSFYFLKKKNRFWLIFFASWLGSMHQPTFLIFGLSYFIYTVINYKKDFVYNVVNGVIIILLTLLSYIGLLKELILPGLKGVVTLEIGAGTFINILQYQSLFLILTPFLFLGVYNSFRFNKINILFIWFFVNLIIVIFKLIFFNRYIIHLDIIFIILASIGLFSFFEKNKVIAMISFGIIICFSFYIITDYALKTKPWVNKEKLDEIEKLKNVEGYVMSTHKNDSPWILGYSGKKTIAPGLFSFTKWSLNDWNTFWTSTNFTEVKPLLDMYEKPIYIYVNPIVKKEKFNNDCFTKFSDNIYKYIC